MLSLLAGLALLAAMGAMGVAGLRRATTCLEPLEQLAYGVPLGTVVGSLVMLGLATAFGLSAPLVIAVGLVSAIAAVALWPRRPPLAALRAAPIRAGGVRDTVAAAARWVWTHLGVWPALVIGAFVLRWAILWRGALTNGADGLWASPVNIWWDWGFHLADTMSFAAADNFPPESVHYAGHPLAYHYLPSLTAAALVRLGLDPFVALTLHSFLFSVPIALGLFAFARRLTLDRGAATLALVLFLLGGGLTWLITVGEMDRSHSVWGTLSRPTWDGGPTEALNFRWYNVYLASIAPQRGWLYGLPLALLVLTLLFVAVRTSERRTFAAAGIVAGLFPLAHLGSMLALALITPFLFLLFPSRRWIVFFGAWIAIAVPQLYVQQGGERGPTSALRLHAGWLAAPDPWPWFWLKNLGLFLPLLALALVDRRLFPPPTRRFLWAFMPVFVIVNLVVFQPWDWDNTKVLIYWFLAVCVLVAALLAKTWRQHRDPVVRCMVASAVAMLVLSGLLWNLYQLQGKGRTQLLTAEEVALGEAVLARTPADALFVIGLQHSHPVPMLAGRRVLMSYPFFLWTWGIDHAQRERDLRAIYALAPDAPQLLSRYGVDYVVIGPAEQKDLGANLAAYRARYPSPIRTANYEVFAVGDAAGPAAADHRSGRPARPAGASDGGAGGTSSGGDRRP